MTGTKKQQVDQEGPKLVEVTLTGEHTHRGKPRKKGDKIKVTEKQRDWLIEAGKVDSK